MANRKTQSDPPFTDHYREILKNSRDRATQVVEECDLPLIDIRCLWSKSSDQRNACVAQISKASSEWGFFQVLNHGISTDLLGKMRAEQIKVFELPFEMKKSCRLLNDSYRWGTPTATCVNQLSWSEAFHVPLAKISGEDYTNGEFSSLRTVMEQFSAAMAELAQLLAGILAENLGQPREFFRENCDAGTCFLRLNRYPACPISPEIFGLMPHTDSDFLTILYQDQVGGLQLMKDSRWVSVKPNPDALIVNIGDLFQAWSNNIYKSVEHKVMANEKTERFSVAYFLCPSYDSVIGSCRDPPLYRNFTFGEFRKQVQEDLRKTGYKVGLPRFLL